MMLAQAPDFEVWQRAVREQFREGESLTTVLLGVGILVGVVVLVLVAGRIQARWHQSAAEGPQHSSPQRLYTHLLCALGFSAAHRRVLESLGRASKLANPAALLISEVLFDRAVDVYAQGGLQGHPGPDEAAMLASARSRLFPEGRGMVQSAAGPGRTHLP